MNCNYKKIVVIQNKYNLLLKIIWNLQLVQIRNYLQKIIRSSGLIKLGLGGEENI
jgi:hypothetical protein